MNAGDAGIDAARIGRNLREVRDRMDAARARAARADAVKLVAVTKTAGPRAVEALYAAGARDFGENRVADGLAKIAAARAACPSARWHLIGHLQRNKAALALSGFGLLHGVESPGLVDVLARALERESPEASAEILLEVNISGEAGKYGVAPDGLPALLDKALSVPALRVRGLMAMAPFHDDPSASRPHFARLRELRDRMAERFGAALPELSMGMSGDYEVAIEEGATWVRVGTALFR